MGRLPRTTFRGLNSVHMTLRPAYSPHRLAACLSRRLRRFCCLPAASIATGWSDLCRVGFAPTEEPRLFTTHRHPLFIVSVSGCLTSLVKNVASSSKMSRAALRNMGLPAARGREGGCLGLWSEEGGCLGPRLSDGSIGNLVPALGHRAGLTRRVKPHGLRHEAITAALDATGGDVRRVQRFSRHKDVRTLTRYDDRRTDDAGTIARLIDEE